MYHCFCLLQPWLICRNSFAKKPISIDMPAVVLGSSIHMFIRCWFLLTLLEVVTRNYFNSPANFLSVCPFSFHKYLKIFPPHTIPSHEWWFEFFHYIFFVLFCSSAKTHTASKLPKSVWLSLWGKLLNDIGDFHFSFHATLC